MRVVLRPINGLMANTTYVFYARHTNRLADQIINLNDGRPEHKIQVRRVDA